MKCPRKTSDTSGGYESVHPVVVMHARSQCLFANCIEIRTYRNQWGSLQWIMSNLCRVVECEIYCIFELLFAWNRVSVVFIPLFYQFVFVRTSSLDTLSRTFNPVPSSNSCKPLEQPAFCSMSSLSDFKARLMHLLPSTFIMNVQSLQCYSR